MNDKIIEALEEAGAEFEAAMKLRFSPEMPLIPDTEQVFASEEGRVIVGYLCLSGNSDDFWGDRDAGEFKPFKHADERDAYQQELRDCGKLAFSSNDGVLTLPAEIEVAVKSGEMTLEQAEKYADSTLKEYGSYCEGDVYGWVVETVDIDLETGAIAYKEIDSCWNYIGLAYATDTLKEEMDNRKDSVSAPSLSM